MDDLISSPEPRTRRVPRSVTAVAIALGLTLGAAGIAVAASPPPLSESATKAVVARDGDRIAERRGHRGEKHRGERGERGLGGPGRALHGEAVVGDGKGGFRTVAFQRGEVTAVSPTSLTVKSADGFSRTYALTAATKVNRGRAVVGDIKNGHRVVVRADVVGSTATAGGIRDAALRSAEKTD